LVCFFVRLLAMTFLFFEGERRFLLVLRRLGAARRAFERFLRSASIRWPKFLDFDRRALRFALTAWKRRFTNRPYRVSGRNRITR
jgi:hypothetical protein